MQINQKQVIGRVMAIFVLVMLLNAGYHAYHQMHSPFTATAESLPEVAAVKPTGREVTIDYGYIGQVEAINMTDIVPYISGYVEEIAAKGGAEVKKGDVLAVVKQDEYIAALEAASADLAAANADYFNAEKQYERMQKAGEKAVSKTEMDNAEAAYLSAKGALEKARAEQSVAQTNLDYTYLKAPFDGVLGNIDLSLGEYISPASRNLMQLVQYDPIRVVFSVSDKEYLKHLHAPQNSSLKIRLRLANGEMYAHEGEIDYAANAVDAATDSVAIYTEFANPDGKLLPNAYVEVFLERTFDDVILFPKEDTMMRPDGDYVYAITGGVFQERKVKVLSEYNNQYVLENDFSDDEYLPVEEIDARLLGQKVTVKLPQTAETAE